MALACQQTGFMFPSVQLVLHLQNNPNAFAMTERQKIEGAAAVHMEETRVKMMMAIGQAPPLDDGGMLRHLQEFAHEVGGSWWLLPCNQTARM